MNFAVSQSDRQWDRNAMTADASSDDVLRRVYAMSRQVCMAELRRIDRPRLDFTDEFLAAQSVDRLRHLLVAAHLQARKSRPARK
jgi:predicted ribonuclease YlaK